LSAILLHTSNFRRRGAYIFSSVCLHFSPLGGEFSTRIIEVFGKLKNPEK